MGNILYICMLLFYEHQMHQNSSPYPNRLGHLGGTDRSFFRNIVSRLGILVKIPIPSASHGICIPAVFHYDCSLCTLVSLSKQMAQRCWLQQATQNFPCLFFSKPVDLSGVRYANENDTINSHTSTMDCCYISTLYKRAEFMDTPQNV